MASNNDERMDTGASGFKDELKIKTASLSSSLLVETYTHTWKMIDFNHIPFISKYPIRCPHFILGKGEKNKFQIVMTKQLLKPHKTSKDREGDSDSYSDIAETKLEAMEVNLQKNVKNAVKKPPMLKRLGFCLVKIVVKNSVWDVINYTFTLKTLDGFSVRTQSREESGDSMLKTNPNFIFVTEKDFEGRNLFKEKCLEVVCDITYKYWKDHPVRTPTICEESRLAQAFKHVYLKKKFTDILLKIGDTEISAHKSVLCARASEFENLIEEVKLNKNHIFDLQMDAEVGKAFIHFLYCGDLPNGFPIAKLIDLFRVADFHWVENLKKRCSEYFKNHLRSGICEIDLGFKPSELNLEKVVELDSAKTKRMFSKQCTHNIEVNL